MNALCIKLSGQKIQCQACNHFCVIAPGKRGLCGVRENQNGQLKLLVYGKPIALNLDPIEKKPLYHFLPGTDVFSLGTVGCNFRCDFCQNWDISQGPRLEGTIPYSKEFSPQAIVDYCFNNHIPSIAYTYNEPTVFFEYAFDTAQCAREKGIKNIFVSNGYTSKQGIKKIAAVLDANNIDLKSFRDDFYQQHCGARLQPVLEAIELFLDLGVWVEVTTLVIPYENDSEQELRQIANFLVSLSPDLPWHLSRFYPQYQMMDVPPTDVKILQRAYEIGKSAGLHYVYIGNVRDEQREHTYCPKCSKIVIERKGYSIENYLKQDQCPKCGEKIAGVFI